MIHGVIAIRDTRLLDSGTVSVVAGPPSEIENSSWNDIGIPMMFASSKTLATEILESKPDRIIFKLRQEYTPKVLSFSKPVNSLITLTLNEEGKVVYHKDMWNEKDYSHEGLGKIMKTMNGDHLTKITRPPADL
jgi:hypothetical protein